MYFRFPLLLRNVEDLLHEHCPDVGHETIGSRQNRFDPIGVLDRVSVNLYA